jgi:predicted component of type VI protein secretion system
MAGFKNPNLVERQEAAAKARKAALEKFLAKAADPALAERLTARTAGAAERKAVRTVREAEKAETKARDAERALKAERDTALQAERDKAERAEREVALQAKQKADRDARYAARKSKSKRK